MHVNGIGPSSSTALEPGVKAADDLRRDGLLSHAREVDALRLQAKRLERRRRLLSRLIFGQQRCNEDSCEPQLEALPLGSTLSPHYGERMLLIRDRFEAYLAQQQQRCEVEGCVL